MITSLKGYIVLGRGAVLDDPKLIELGKKYSKTPAQIAIRWSLQVYFLPEKNRFICSKSFNKVD